MELREVKAIVNHTDTKKYRAKYANGKSEIVRLWLNDDDCVCKIGQRKRHYGHYLSWDMHDVKQWVSLKLVEHKPNNRVRLVKKRAQDALKYLTESGFWANIKKEIEYFISDDSIIEEFCKDMAKDSYNCFYLQCGDGKKYSWCHSYQIFESFYRRNCWKSIAYNKWNRDYYNNLVKNAIAEKRNYTNRWVNGYDNSLEIRFDEDCARAWYSEEYRNTGNGHYYLLFDATHAIFYEDD